MGTRGVAYPAIETETVPPSQPSPAASTATTVYRPGARQTDVEDTECEAKAPGNTATGGQASRRYQPTSSPLPYVVTSTETAEQPATLTFGWQIPGHNDMGREGGVPGNTSRTPHDSGGHGYSVTTHPAVCTRPIAWASCLGVKKRLVPKARARHGSRTGPGCPEYGHFQCARALHRLCPVLKGEGGRAPYGHCPGARPLLRCNLGAVRWRSPATATKAR